MSIGTTVGLSPSAQGSVAGVLALGSGVVQDETVRTGPQGVLELKFLDGTHLGLDRASAVKLDRFVYSVSKTGDQVVLRLTRGAFRFATGSLPKASYKIETPLASIGVRGTVLSIETGARATRVTLEHGGALVCSRRGSRQCAELDRTNHSVIVGPDGRLTRTKTAVRLSLLCQQLGSSSTLCSGRQKRASLNRDEGVILASERPPTRSSPGPQPGPDLDPRPAPDLDPRPGRHPARNLLPAPTIPGTTRPSDPPASSRAREVSGIMGRPGSPGTIKL